MEEAFLINPVRRRRARFNPRGLPGPLLSRMIRAYGPQRGMREAWKAYRLGARRNEPELNEPELNPWETIHYPARTARLWRGKLGRFAIAPGRRRKNPLGEEVMIVGNEPGRRRKRRKRRNLELNAWFGDPAGHRAAALKGWRRRKGYAVNAWVGDPKGHRLAALKGWARRRRLRRNEPEPARRAELAGLPAISIQRPMSLVVPAAVGTASYMACEYIPSKIGMVTTWPRLGVKAAIGIGGGMLVSRFAGRQNGTVWTIVAGVNILQDILKTFVLKTAVSGLGAFPYQGYRISGTEAASGYEGVEAYPEEVGSPY